MHSSDFVKSPLHAALLTLNQIQGLIFRSCNVLFPPGRWTTRLIMLHQEMRAAYLNFKKYIHIQIYQYLCVNTPDVGVSEPLYNLDGRISTLQQVMQPYNYIWLVLPLTFHQMSWTYKNTNQHYISRKCKRKKKQKTKLLSPRIIKFITVSVHQVVLLMVFSPCLLHN